MQQAATRELYAYWDALRGRGAAPERDAIEPGPIRRVLADTFILSVEPDMGHPFRLAGTRVCAIFGRELKGEAFLKLWDAESRTSMRALFSVVTGEAVCVAAGVIGRTASGKTLDLEMLILPLALRGKLDARALGALLPPSPPYWLGIEPVTTLALGALRYVSESRLPKTLPRRRASEASLAPRPHPMRDVIAVPALAHAPGGKIRHGLIVYEGGKTELE